MDDMSTVPSLTAVEYRLTLHVASLGDAQYLRIRRVHSAGMCTKHCIVNLNKLTT